MSGQVLIIHECSECGYIEGESPQAGCCPGCGIASDPKPFRVTRLSAANEPPETKGRDDAS